jgi:peptide/nickel transport system substrate-binding protein
MDYLRFGILPKHILEGQSFDEITSSTFNLEPVGTGPYKLDQLEVADSGVSGLSLKINEDYYGKKPYLERILIQYYPTSRQAYTAYLEGKVQGISFLSSDVLPDALKDENLSIFSSRKPEMSLVFINLKNTQVEFLQDLNIRKALMYSINRSYIINQLLDGQAIAANSPIFPGSWAYYDSDPYVYDIEEATNILKNAGYTFVKDGDLVRSKDDVYLTFTLLHPDDEYHSKIADALAKDWKRIGIEAILSPVPYDQLIDGNLVQRDYQAALVDMNLSSYPDPDPYPFWDQAQATGGQNYSQWDNRAASEYLEQARITVDPIERKRQYANFQVIFRKEIPSLLLYYPVYSYAIDVQVQGVQIGPLYDASDRFMTINDWFLTVRRSNPLDSNQPSATP